MTDFYRSRKKRNYENKELSGPDYGSERPTKRLNSNQQDDPAAKGYATYSNLQCQSRTYTVSVAIPSSILDTAPTHEMKTILAGQLARILVLFSIDEVIIYEDNKKRQSTGGHSIQNHNLFLARLFQYMETPPYLRKQLVPISSDLKFAGLLPPLEVPHHPTKEEITIYREGVTLDKVNKNAAAVEDSTLVDVGLYRRARIVGKAIQPGVRVTVELNEPVAAIDTHKGQKPLPAKVISPKIPKEKMGLYWGYSIRLASSFSRVMTESPYKEGYDYSIGVSDRGKDAQDMYECQLDKKIKAFGHMLIAFGGPMGGLQEAIEADEDLKVGGDEAAELFDLFIDPNSKSGTRAVRLEESMTMVMSVLKPVIKKKGKNS